MAFWKRKKKSANIGFFIYRRDLLSDSSVPGDGFPGVRLFCNVGFILGIMTWVELWEQERDCPIGEKQTVPYALLSLYLVYAAREAVHSGNFASGSVSGGVAA